MKKILLAVCGKTPQIITETLYALWEQGNIPDVIKIITTKAGKDAIITKLLDPTHGIFYKFCNEYEINPENIDFSWQNIIVPKNNGLELEDILSEEDSFCFLQSCLEETFSLTSDINTEIYFSLAAGRKTMGASLTAAAQLYGRKQDKLFHILVHSDFEYSPYFYYPPKIPQTIELMNSIGEKYYKSTQYAKVTLVAIPFFSVRDTLTLESLAKPFLPQDLLSLVERNIKPKLKIYIRSCKIEWQGKAIKLPVAWFTLYVFFILRRKNIKEIQDCYIDILTIENHNKEIASLYQKISQFIINKDTPPSDTGIVSLTNENIRSYRSKVNTEIKKNFGQMICEEIGISSFGQKPNTVYGISLSSELIEIIDEVGEKWS